MIIINILKLPINKGNKMFSQKLDGTFGNGRGIKLMKGSPNDSFDASRAEDLNFNKDINPDFNRV